jgi:HD-like signal output (HDOD) protein
METIAKLLNIKLPEHAFTAGIMHDIGKILLGSFIDVKSELIISYAENENISFPEAEQEILGIDHAEAGAILIEKWELPEEFYKPLRLHHKPEEAEGDMVTELVHLADVLTLMEGIGTGRDGLRYKVSNKTAEKYQLTPSLIERTICETKVRYDEVKGLLG